MEVWRLMEIATPEGTRDPIVLDSTAEGRAVLIGFQPGQQLGDHTVKERSWLTVLDGSVEIEADGRTIEAAPGTLVSLAPNERHAVRSANGARVLLFLSPWPGEGHYRGGGANSPG